MYSVVQKISFCYGHRLMNHAGKCRNLHGHNGVVEMQLDAAELNQQGMVADFIEIKRIAKAWIDANLDHKLLLHKNDVLIDSLSALKEAFIQFDFHPTAEALAAYIYHRLRALGLPIRRITFFETRDSSAVYQEKNS